MASARTNEMVEDSLARSRLQVEKVEIPIQTTDSWQLRGASLGLLLVFLNITSKVVNLLRVMI